MRLSVALVCILGRLPGRQSFVGRPGPSSFRRDVLAQRPRPVPPLFSSATESLLSFEDMKKLENQQLSTLEEIAEEFLMDFYEPHLSSFSIRPGEATRISITSTCYAIRAILASDGSAAYKSVDLSKLLKELKYKPNILFL